VPCPVCKAKPREKCTLMTGHPSNKTHLARGLAAAKAPPPVSPGRAILRFLQSVTSRSLRGLFPPKQKVNAGDEARPLQNQRVK